MRLIQVQVAFRHGARTPIGDAEGAVADGGGLVVEVVRLAL